MKWLFLFLASVCFSFANDSILGQSLEATIWDYINDKNWDGVDSLIADTYQGVHYFGITNKQEEVDYIKRLQVKNYLLSTFLVVRNKDVIIVSYRVSYTSGDTSAVHNDLPRLGVWQKIENEWKLVAHVNFMSTPKR